MRTDIGEIVRISKAYCDAHGLRFGYYEPDGLATIGQSGFRIDDGITLIDLPTVLDICKHDHEEIDKVKWHPGVLQNALRRMGSDDVVRTIIESELAATLDDNVLDEIARIFYKHTRHGVGIK